MTDTKSKTIARNTLLLYMRMLLVMAITLYTVRLVLDALGMVEYGLYNVIAGVVSMMASVNSELSLSVFNLHFHCGHDGYSVLFDDDS